MLRFANFAHGEFALLGAYLTYFFRVSLNLNMVIAALLGIAITGLIGVLSNKLIFKRLRSAGGFILLIAAMGLSIALKNIVGAIWGMDPRSYPIPMPRIYNLVGIRITSTQLLIIIVTGTAMFVFHLLLHRTKLGKAMRATSDNLSLAEASGINVERVITYVWFMCCCFAALGGILIAMETLLWPEMGTQILLSIFAAAILGGIGNIYGAILGAFIIGLAENVGLFLNWAPLLNLGGILELSGSLYIPTGYKSAISFAILIGVLILRPTGILKGQKGD
jgi:branched-subunit amino acid ABC-type transport system permease component